MKSEKHNRFLFFCFEANSIFVRNSLNIGVYYESQIRRGRSHYGNDYAVQKGFERGFRIA
jgi:hypothetical protein